MSSITVSNTLHTPGGGTPAKASCVVELVTGTGAGGLMSGVEVLGRQYADVDSLGQWSKTLIPNLGSTDAIDIPAVTYYRITETADGQTSVYYIQVNGAGTTPTTVDTLLFTP